jgi:hypothetical protein
MAQPELRISQGAALAMIAIVALAVIGMNAGWFTTKATPTVPGTPTGAATDATGTPAFQVVPAIEKTKVYVSTIDQADFDGEQQKNRVVGTVQLIKSGNVLESVTTSASTGVASAAEFNGADVVTALGAATAYYPNALEDVKVTETLQPMEVFIKAAHEPTVSVLDDKQDELTPPYTISLSANDVSKTMYVKIERPGDDTWYQFCGIGLDFNDDVLDVQMKDTTGSYTTGITNLFGTYDELDDLGVDNVWAFNSPIKNFDELANAFIVRTARDIDPSGAVIKGYVFDCASNLQNGKIVYTSENAADADVGLAHMQFNITVN